MEGQMSSDPTLKPGRVSTYSHTLSSALFPIDNGNCLAHPTMLKKFTTVAEKKIVTEPKIFSSKKNITCVHFQ